MGNVIQLNAARASLAKPPADLWKLRWRVKLASGLTVQSAWTPETKYPSIRETMADFAGWIDVLYIDGTNRYTGERTTFLTCPGDALSNLSYKGMASLSSGRSIVAGIEVESLEGDRYLVLRDGTVYVEERKAVNVSNHD